MAPRKLADRLTPELISGMTAEYIAGASLEQLGPKFGCSPEGARSLLIRHGVVLRPPGQRPRPLTPTKMCSSCGAELPREQFYGNGKKTSECPRCLSEKGKDRYRNDPGFRARRRAATKRWQGENRGLHKALQRRWYSGWTQELFDAAWVAQRGKCAICRLPMKLGGTNGDSVCADHDHLTGRLRELLCGRCNKSLGIYEKNKDVFEAYVRKHRQEV